MAGGSGVTGMASAMNQPKPAPKYNTDANTNYREAIFQGNENIMNASKDYSTWASDYMSKNLASGSGATAGRNNVGSLVNSYNKSMLGYENTAKDGLNNAFTGYDDRTRALIAQMGTADQDIHGRTKANAYAGLDSGFGGASDSLQAQLAQRGMANSGVFAKSMGDLATQRGQAGVMANMQSYNDAVGQSDARRGMGLSAEDRLYGAETGNIKDIFGMASNRLGTGLGHNVQGSISNANNQTQASIASANNATQASIANSRMGMDLGNNAFQNSYNANQTRIGNLTGMREMGNIDRARADALNQQSYNNYGGIGNSAGAQGNNFGSLGVNYNNGMNGAQSEMNQARSAQSQGKGSMMGSAIGAGVSLMSDKRLKDNLVEIGQYNGFTIYRWDWNDLAKDVGADSLPNIGVIAQEVQETHPEYVSLNKRSGYLQVNYRAVLSSKGLSDG